MSKRLLTKARIREATTAIAACAQQIRNVEDLLEALPVEETQAAFRIGDVLFLLDRNVKTLHDFLLDYAD